MVPEVGMPVKVMRLLTITTLMVLLLFGLIGMILFSRTVTPRLGVFASALLFSCASLSGGGLLGFLFGVPRTLTTESGGLERSDVRANTNLEQVSDWLTKILIGATLVQLGNVPGAASRLFAAMAPSLGGANSSAAFAGAIVIYFSILGFLAMWMSTRLYLGRAMRDADTVRADLLMKADAAESAGAKELASDLRAIAERQ